MMILTAIGFTFMKFKDINHLKKEIIEYIKYYNNKRIKLNLKGMSPILYQGSLLSNLIINSSKLLGAV